MIRRSLSVTAALLFAACSSRPVDDGSSGPAVAESASCDGTKPAPPQTWTTRSISSQGRGLVATDDGVLVASVASVLTRSADLGMTWAVVGPTDQDDFSSLSSSGKRLLAIGASYDPDRGEQWRPYESTDRGASWHVMPGAPAVDDTTKLLAAGTTTAYAGFLFDGSTSSLYATHDLDASWTSVADPYPAGPAGASYEYGYPLWARSDDEIYAAGFTTSAGGDPTFGPVDAHIMRSLDGGRTFVGAPLSVGAACSPAAVWGRGTSELFVAGNGCRGGDGYVQRSTDGGATFAVSATPSFPLTDQNHGTGWSFNAVSGNARGDLLAVGSQGAVLYSSDDGASFTSLTVPVSPGVIGVGADLVGVWVGPCGEVVILAEDGTITTGR